jgi:glycosyltransferase involved in cell wall biosynthesis
MAAEHPILTVAVPVYNAEATLERSVRSIMENRNVDLEILLINDGSKDHSGEICDRLAAEDPRIRVIHKENGGVGSARRTGIDNARGKYLAYVDSDDFAEPHMYETMVALGEEHDADMVICSMVALTATEPEEVHHVFGDHILRGHENIYERILVPMITPQHPDATALQGPCNKLYRVELIRKHDIRFPDLPRAEDWMFNIEFFRRAECIAFTSQCLYCYDRTTPGSLSKTLPANGFDHALWIRRRLTELFPDRYQEKDLIPMTLRIQKQELLQWADCVGFKGFVAYAMRVFRHPQLREAYEALPDIPKEYRFAGKCVLCNWPKRYVLWSLWIAKGKFVKHMLRPLYHGLKKLLGK